MSLHHSHRKHRNVLYSLVVVLVILQTTSFVMLSIQISKLNVRLDDEMQTAQADILALTQELEESEVRHQENFQILSETLAQQQKDFSQEIKLLKSSQEDFSGVVEDAVKSVVTISTDRSVGSGFIIHPSGYVVTNHHVIQGSEDSINVLTYERKRYEAEYIGSDTVRDLALLKIPGTYQELELAERSELQVGKKVIAIGNPLGLSFTVTEGIISGLDRLGPNGLEEYVQTDVSLNPGNSGGPLIDIQGKVVGINNFKIGGAEALGFSLESTVIRDRVNEIANETIVP